MSVDLKTRERILKAVEDIRTAVVRLDDPDRAPKTVTVHRFTSKSQPQDLHLMLPKSYRSIW